MKPKEAEHKGPTLVVASNDPRWSRFVEKALKGYENPVRITRFNRSLLQILANESPTILLFDLQHGKKSDLKLCRQIINRPDKPSIYMLFAADSAALKDPKREMLGLADDFVPKPVSRATLLARILISERALNVRLNAASHEAQMQGLRADLEEQNRLLDEALTYLSGANNRFAELFEGIPAACYCLDDQGRIHEWNKAAAEMYGYQAHEVISRYIWDVFKDSAYESRKSKETLARLIAGECLRGKELAVRCKDDRSLHVLRNTITITTSDQKTRGVMTADIDITARRELEKQVLEQLRTLTDLNAELKIGQKELARANAQLERLAATDSLTGLRNRRFFQDTLVRSFSFAERHRLPLSLIMIDVDRFKSYNDCFGHPAGDDLLKSLARLLEHGVRNHDCIARYGGEEFVVLLPTTAIEGSKEVAERLRSAVAAFEWPLRPVTISVGAATILPDDSLRKDPVNELVKSADKALYLAKANGRNRIEHFTDIPNPSRSHHAHGRGAKRAA
ncbi:MAG TPA: diguanylate cyclase [Capsulimonadaceae bacterium]|nr:diguanylate cyclase [Capsulimonadaceae bacterium]